MVPSWRGDLTDGKMRALLLERWNGTIMHVHGEAIDVMALPALIAENSIPIRDELDLCLEF